MSQLDDIKKPITDKPEWPNDPFQPNKHMEDSISNGTVPAVVEEIGS